MTRPDPELTEHYRRDFLQYMDDRIEAARYPTCFGVGGIGDARRESKRRHKLALTAARAAYVRAMAEIRADVDGNR